MKRSLSVPIIILVLLGTSWTLADARGDDRIITYLNSVDLICDGRLFRFFHTGTAASVAAALDDLIRYCHVTSHIDRLKQWLQDRMRLSEFRRLVQMGVWKALCDWRNEILNRSYAGKWGQYIRDRESGHVRRGTISQRCLSAENNLDREINKGSAQAQAAALNCMQQCGADLYSSSSSVAERGYYEGTRCASRLIYKLCA